MNCFTSLGNVLFTFHVQGCSALVIVVVVVVVGTLVVVLASFQHDNTSTSPNISGTDSACQPTKQPVRQTDKQTDGPSASGTQLPSCWVLFGFWAIKFVVLQLSVNVHTPTQTHTHNPSAPRLVISATSKIQFYPKYLRLSLKRSISNALQWPHLFIYKRNLQLIQKKGA